MRIASDFNFDMTDNTFSFQFTISDNHHTEMSQYLCCVLVLITRFRTLRGNPRFVCLYVSGLSSCLSLLSMAWSLTAYTDALHIAYEKFYKRTALSVISQTLWQLGMVASRVFAIVLFATVFQSIVMVPLGKL